ncbi:hypothetical protein AAG570_008742, partial [Ranatra chinensis]
TEHQHTRYNPLKGEWILVSPHRALRPWTGQNEQEPPQQDGIPEFDASNPLCPGVTRPNGMVTPNYTSTFVFTNDYPALNEDCPVPKYDGNPLFRMGGAKGTCRVVCFHPKSNVTIPTMTIEEIMDVIEIWISQTVELGKKYDWVQIFENKGTIMGCSNPHPHCQIWASSFVPNEPRIKDIHQLEYYNEHNSPMLMDYLQQEMEKMERIVAMNSEWVVLVPFWAVWPFETMILPKRHVRRFYDLDAQQKSSLAHIVKLITIKYDNLFNVSFPYSMGWHGAPTGSMSDVDMAHWVFHGMYYPPLLRSASVKKFMVGYEMFAQSQRDLTPETAAARLRDMPEIHYTEVPGFKKTKLEQKTKTPSPTTKKSTPKSKNKAKTK